MSSSRVYYANGADELVFLNIARERRTIAPLLKVLEEVSQVLFVPLAAGGGVWSVKDARALINGGADKVVINTAAYHQTDLIARVAELIGCQSIMVSIDVRREGSTWHCYSNCGQRLQDIPLIDHIQSVCAQGAGEILINSIDRDGMRAGYDLELLQLCCKHAGSTPVVGCGGVGTYQDMLDGFNAGLDAAACGSLFNFGDNNPLRAKAYLRNHHVVCR